MEAALTQMPQQIADGHWLPVVFVALMGVSILIYVILDGFDLGVGILFAGADDKEKDLMIASIGPFWDANETWLVMAVGLLLVAFPAAHGLILTTLYMPVFIMLIGLILRGVAFDFRVKVPLEQKYIWNWCFWIGSVLASCSQGYMLGIYVVGLDQSFTAVLFGLLTGICLLAGYAFIGACWLIMKTEGELQKKSVLWARKTIGWVALGLAVISLATPFVSPRIFDKWFSMPELILKAPLPLMTILVLVGLYHILKMLPHRHDRYCWVPFVGAISVFFLGFIGMAYSFYPYVVPDKMTVWQASSSPESLFIILVGVMTVLPIIFGYSVYAYRVFWGKTQLLSYGEMKP